MKNSGSNIRIVAEANEMNGFDIFVDISGSREYLMSHRNNEYLYKMLAKGMYLDSIRRWRPNSSYRAHTHRARSVLSMKAQKAVRYLLAEIDDYLLHREGILEFSMDQIS